jgi:hypothetical protein
MSFFKLSTGQTAASTTNFEIGGSLEPIPEGTKVRACVTEAGWKEYQGDRYINLRWDVVESGMYSKRVIFQNVKVYESDPAKADRQKQMLAAIDANCGGKLQQCEAEPTDIELMKALTNKPMIIRLGVWDMNGKQGNWVQAVESSSGAKPTPKSTPKKDDDEDQIPF